MQSKQNLAQQIDRELANANNMNETMIVPLNTREENTLFRTQEKLKQTTAELEKLRKQLEKTRSKLELANNENTWMKQLLTKQEALAKRLLFKWLAKDSQQKVENILKHYRTEQRLEMISAMQVYVLAGKRTRFDREVQNWHFRLFCDMIEDDCYTDSVHALLKRLWTKIGLITTIAK